MRYHLGVLALVLSFFLTTAVSPGDVYGQDTEVTMIVTMTDGQGARLRESPSTSARVIVVIDEGSRVAASVSELAGDGRLWRKVDDHNGNVGYVVSDFLADLSEVYAVSTVTPEPTATPAPLPASPQQSQSTVTLPPAGSPACYDAFARFRYTDVETTWFNGMIDAGYNPLRANPLIAQMRRSAPHTVAGWVAVSLIRNRQGYDAPTLGQWIREGNTMSFRLTPDEWNAMLAWEPDSCEGSFVHNPDNAELMRLVRNLVQTPRPVR